MKSILLDTHFLQDLTDDLDNDSRTILLNQIDVDLRTNSKALIEAYENNDYQSIYDVCHKLKTIGGTFGMDTLGSDSDIICIAYKNEDFQSMISQLEKLKNYLPNIISQLKEFIENHDQ